MALTKRTKVVTISSVSVLILFLACFAYYFAFSYHFRTVIPGEVYRSGEMSQQAFNHYIQKYHIKSVVNLRGSHPYNTWYKDETAAIDANGVHQYNIPAKAHGFPSISLLQNLVVILQTAPKPILVHCRSGMDRSGLASAILVVLSGNPSLTAAEQQFSFAYLVTAPDSVGKMVFQQYTAWLQKNKLAHNEDNFLAWIKQL